MMDPVVNEKDAAPPPGLAWDCGTAYDFFVSLHVLHNPEKFGLRGSWAAGVRSRVPAAERKLLEEGEKLIHVPLHWIHALPKPKDSAAALWSLGRLSPAERLPALAISPETPPDAALVFRETAGRGSWQEADLERLREAYQSRPSPPNPRNLVAMLEIWSRPIEFGESYLAALQSYQQAFFAEEERRITPHLQSSLSVAQERAGEIPLPALIEELSQGVSFSALAGKAGMILAPSYWSTPLVVFSRLSSGQMLLLFGARPAEASLVPGEVVPDALLRSLKALADPTRLRILRYLAGRPYTPAQLSRRLRLRPPTVIHHLNILRLAGLVRLSIESEGERRYAARQEALAATFGHLKDFISEEDQRDND